ncbi:MAG: PorT family protein, partial [Bacteroidetes bacterium]|nr:PorT family protein [Bacteroidota bacterium]
MKKLLFAVLLLTSTSAIFAQGFQLGIKAGANASNFTGGDFRNVDKKALIGFHAGAF